MRRILVACCAVVVVAGLTGQDVDASCGSDVPVAHAFDSYFECADATPVAAFMYRLTDPLGTHSGTVDVICEATVGGGTCGPGDGTPGDGRAAIYTDWFEPRFAGCISPPGIGPQRLVVFVQGNDGDGLLVSLGGLNPGLGYAVEAAHPYDPSTSAITPLSCGAGAGRPTILSQSTSDGVLTLMLRLRMPRIVSDCDPGTLGMALGGCPDGFVPTLGFGRIYTRVGPCTTAPDLSRSLWTDTGVVPDSTGFADLTLAAAPIGQCLYAGGTTIINGYESGSVTGFVTITGDSCVDADGDGVRNCLGDCDDHDAARFPGNPELCDGIDNDCNGVVDDSAQGIDSDFDGVPNACDNCPTIPNADQDPLVCDQRIDPVTIQFGSPQGKGSGIVSWTVTHEVDVDSFNVVDFDPQGKRTQLNLVPIPCEECVTGLPYGYQFIVPKHRGGKDIFVELIRRNGTITLFGPAVRN